MCSSRVLTRSPEQHEGHEAHPMSGSAAAIVAASLMCIGGFHRGTALCLGYAFRTIKLCMCIGPRGASRAIFARYNSRLGQFYPREARGGTKIPLSQRGRGAYVKQPALKALINHCKSLCSCGIYLYRGSAPQ